MGDREKLAQTIYEALNKSKTCYRWDDGGLDDEHPGARNRFYLQADAILASDWLRDTLAAERRAGLIAGQQWALEKLQDWGELPLSSDLAREIVRNLAPKENDDARG